MASEVSICNLALNRMGDKGGITSIDPPEESTQAKLCAVLYPASLAAVLEAHDWRFATRRAQLAELTNLPTYGWLGVFALPSRCQRVISVKPKIEEQKPESEEGSQPVIRPYHPRAPWGFGLVAGTPLWSNVEFPFVVEAADTGNILYTNVREPVIQYIVSEPAAGNFTPLFADALAWHLSAALVGAMVKGQDGAKLVNAMEARYRTALEAAKVKDASQHYEPVRRAPVWIRER